MKIIALSNRQKQIAEIVRLDGPITGEHIAERLNVTRAALRSDLAILVTMFLEDVGTVFVLDEEGMLNGILSRKDLLKAAINNNDLRDIPVVMVMTPISKIIVATPDEPAASAARRLIDNEIDCLPVVKIIDEKKRMYQVLGRITKTNFTRLLVDLAEGKGGNYHNNEA